MSKTEGGREDGLPSNSSGLDRSRVQQLLFQGAEHALQNTIFTLNLYVHGSAILSTVQQVAGAVGGALLVTLMAGREASLSAQGSAPVAAQIDGFQLAFPVSEGNFSAGSVPEEDVQWAARIVQ